ncbi:hypothetical protein Tco_1375189 [Tanacetum coccineum]
MPPWRNMNINDVYEQEFKQRIMARMEERLAQFDDQLADRMNDMMNKKTWGSDEEEEYHFVDNYQNFQEEANNVSFLNVVLGVEEESMPFYNTDIEDVIEKKERFVEKRRFGEEEDNLEDVVVVAND